MSIAGFTDTEKETNVTRPSGNFFVNKLTPSLCVRFEGFLCFNNASRVEYIQGEKGWI